MKRFISLLISFLLLSTVALAGNIEKEIHHLINQYRQKKKLPPLEYSGTIASAAQKHSVNMASRRVPFGHSGFDARTDKLLKNIKGAKAVAENVAYGSKTAEAVVNMWINSKGHRKNIEGKYNLTGIGVATSRDGRLYFTQIFILRQ